MAGIDTTKTFQPLGVAVMVVSDSRTKKDDRSGALLAEKIADAEHRLIAHAIVPDDIAQITQQAKTWIADPAVEIIIATGGTGLTKRDVSHEAFSALYQKTITGFAMMFHQVSVKQVGLAAVQSRASAGVCDGVLIFSLPGSPNACRDAWDEILVFLLDSRYRPCNLAELLPRFV